MIRAIVRASSTLLLIALASAQSSGRDAEAAGPGTWSAAAPLSAPYAGATSTLLPNGKVLLSFGQNSANSSIFDPIANTWSLAAVAPTARSGHTSTLLHNGKVLVADGATSLGAASADLYDPSFNSWSAAAAPVVNRLAHAAVLLVDGRVFVAGGEDPTSLATLSSAELYDPATNAWAPAATMVRARAGAGAVLLPSGKVLVAGGSDGATRINVAELYDPATNTWTDAGTLPDGADGYQARLLPTGKVLVAGGATSGFPPASTLIASAELYDPASNAWSPAAPMLAARAGGSVTLLGDGTILVAGGFTGSFTQTDSTEIYDPLANTWTAAASLISQRFGHQAALLPDGRVLVAGGSNVEVPTFVATELYDPPLTTGPGLWRSAARMTVARANHTTTPLLDGVVLVTGGGAANAERYSPASDLWSAAGTMSAAREGASAVRLADGRVLVVGGSVGGVDQNTAEIYNPATNSWAAAAPMIEARYQPAAVRLAGGRVFVFGAFTNSPEIYTPATNTWAAAAAAPGSPFGPAAVLLADGRVLAPWSLPGVAAGGIYDPVSDTWAAMPALPGSPIVIGTLATLANGVASISGGQNYNELCGFYSIPQTWLFNPSSTTWLPSASMSLARGAHAATLLSDGRLLVSGGIQVNASSCGSGVYSQTAESYDPLANTWTPVASMNIVRYGHGSALLPNANVLVTGGSNGTAAKLASAEIYDRRPQVDTDGDGYSDGIEGELGQHPFAACAIMRADVNGDGRVNAIDLAKVAAKFGVVPAPLRLDQNADAVIGANDLGRVAQKVGQSVLSCP